MKADQIFTIILFARFEKILMLAEDDKIKRYLFTFHIIKVFFGEPRRENFNNCQAKISVYKIKSCSIHLKILLKISCI